MLRHIVALAEESHHCAHFSVGVRYVSKLMLGQARPRSRPRTTVLVLLGSAGALFASCTFPDFRAPLGDCAEF